MKFATHWIVLALLAVGLTACSPAPEASASGSSTASEAAAPANTETAQKESAPSTDPSTPAAKSSEAAPAAKTEDASAVSAKSEEGARTEEQARLNESEQDERKRQEEKQGAPKGRFADAKNNAEKPVKDTSIPASPANSKQTPDQRMMEGANLSATQANFVGTWTMKVDPKLKEAQAKLIAEMRKKGQNWSEMSGNVVLRPNGTFTMRETVMAMDDTFEGTYKVNKGVAELTITKINGKDPGDRGKRPRKLVLLKNGKEIRRQDSIVFSKS